MPSTLDQIKRLSRELYPQGRAFKMPVGGRLEQLHAALAESESRAYNDAFSVLDSMFADNANFTADDATAWEIRLGLISGPGVSLSDRMKAINQKLNYPGSNAPRQHHSFIEAELRLAGFDVYVYENNFAGVAKAPEEILGASGATLYSDTTLYGNATLYGGQYSHKIANYLERAKDATFVITNYRSAFYISGSPITTFADVPAARELEFRQLILKLKPAQMCGFLFVNYI